MKYRILDGKIRISQKKLLKNRDRDLRIDLKYPPIILAWLDTVSHVLTLSANPKHSRSQAEIDRIARFFRPKLDQWKNPEPFDALFYGLISVKTLQKDRRHTQPFGADERLLPIGVKTVTRDKARCLDIEVLRFVDGGVV
jgi:hypothetical protein